MFTAKTQRRKAVVITSFVTPQIIAFIASRASLNGPSGRKGQLRGGPGGRANVLHLRTE